MWNRRENEAPAQPAAKREMPASSAREFNAAPARTGNVVNDEGIVNIGQSICIRGELTGNEDLTIEGMVDGKIMLKDHNLTIGANGRISAEIHAKNVSVLGQVIGNIIADDKVELAATGSVQGDIRAPRVAVADGARFKGSIDMERKSAATSTSKSSGLPTTPPAREMPRSASGAEG